MSRSFDPFHFRTGSLIFVGAILCSMTIWSAHAGDATSPGKIGSEQISSEQILNALQPKPLTRSLSTARPDPAGVARETRFLDGLRNRRTRSLSSEEREQISEIALEKPQIDLEITFDYDSADISKTSLPSVQALGRALSNPSLKDSTFVVAGHTDAAGSDAYNRDLSERRADSIKRYLVETSNIPAGNLVTVGYGKTKPKDSNAPMDPANRRVQVINMISKTALN
jgi:outer membrane protein OmpA-like peptidoglycan-associated protein